MTENPLNRGKSQGSSKFMVTAPPPEAEAPELAAVPAPEEPVAETAPVRDEPADVDKPAADEAATPVAHAEPEPEAEPEVKAAPKKKRAAKKTTKKAASGAPPASPAGAGMRLPEIDYSQDPAETRVKDWGMLPPSLMTNIEMARMQWTVFNTEWMRDHGAPPHISGFKEALMRLGLKHINDPEFASLIPLDRRRGKVRRELDALDD